MEIKADTFELKKSISQQKNNSETKKDNYGSPTKGGKNDFNIRMKWENNFKIRVV